MLTEQEVWDVIDPLPDDCYIKQHVNHGYHQNDAPLPYHFASAIAVVATTCSASHVVRNVFKYPTYPNFYTICAGPTGVGKSGAVDMAHDLLLIAAPEMCGSDPISEEAMAKALILQPCQIHVHSEFSSWLRNTQGHDNYKAKIKDAFTRAYDCRPLSRVSAKAPGMPLTANETRLSVLGGCTPAALESYTDMADWEGGLLGRFFYAFCTETERRVARPDPDAARRSWMLQRITAMKTAGEVSPCLGWADDAFDRWAAWEEEFRKRMDDLGERAKGVLQRVPQQVAKIIMLLAWDLGICRGPSGPDGASAYFQPDGWYIGKALVDFAITAAEMHERSLRELVVRIAVTAEMRELKQVQHALDPTEFRSTGEILNQGVDIAILKRLKNYLQTLEARGIAESRTQNADTFWRAIDGDPKPVRYDPGLENLTAPAMPGRPAPGEGGTVLPFSRGS